MSQEAYNMSYKAQGHEALEEGDKGRYFDDKRRN